MSVENPVSLLIESIYSAAIDPDGWGAVVDGLRSAFRADAVLLWRRMPTAQRRGAVTFVGLPDDVDWDAARLTPAFLARSHAEARLAAGVAEEFGSILSFGDRIFGEMPDAWCARLDLERGVAVSVLREADLTSTLELVRAAGSEAFGREAFELMSLLAPHLGRAISIERDRDQNRARRAAATALGERLAMGVILVDGDARVLDVSRRARSTLDGGDGLHSEDGRLCATKAGQTERLRRLIGEAASAAESGDEPSAGLTLLLERPSGRAPLAVEIAGVASRDARPQESQALVYVRDPECGAELSLEGLRRLYGLTRTEAQVTSLIARGMNHALVARELNVTVCAIRFHLKSIYAKTSTQRQAELVYLLATGSAQLTA
jgi:DNA-binding CsgD family transcriptional regulator